MLNMNVQNKIILITGASSGIGEACAHAFAKLGARIILAARSAETLAALKAHLEKTYSIAVYVVVMDVR